MKSHAKSLCLGTAFLLVFTHHAVAQSGHFRWRAGDKPPRLAGFWLGQRLDSARKTMKGAVTVETIGQPPSRALSYSTADRSLSVLGTPAGGVAIITVRRPDVDAIDGVRVGDSCANVVKRWGKPHRADAVVAMWIAGKWLVSAHCDPGGKVSELSVANVA